MNAQTLVNTGGGGHKRSKALAPPDDDDAGNMSSQGRLYLATRAWMEPTSTSLREQPEGSPMPCIASRSTHTAGTKIHGAQLTRNSRHTPKSRHASGTQITLIWDK